MRPLGRWWGSIGWRVSFFMSIALFLVAILVGAFFFWQGKEALKTGLKYVYLGNIPQNPAENTYCHNCQQLIIPRRGYMVGEMKLKEGKCAFCGTSIPGIWSRPKPT